MTKLDSNRAPATWEQKVAAAESLLRTDRVDISAEHAGVSRETLSRWRNHDPEFKALLAELKHGMANLVSDRLVGAADTAVDALIEICQNSESDSARVSAAKEILARMTPGEEPLDEGMSAKDLLGDQYESVAAAVAKALNAKDG